MTVRARGDPSWFVVAVAGTAFDPAQASAAVVAMTSNFFVNNFFAYRDRRLRSFALVRGLFSFYAICALGTAANVGVAGYVFSKNEVWWLAGIAGVIVGSVWNYAVLLRLHLEGKKREISPTAAMPDIG